MIVALVALFVILGGGGTFATEIFSSDAKAAVVDAVADESRAEEAAHVFKKARKDLKASETRAGKIAKELGKADKSVDSGRSELQPFVTRLSEERQSAQKMALDHLFALRETMTEEEWATAFGNGT